MHFGGINWMLGRTSGDCDENVDDGQTRKAGGDPDVSSTPPDDELPTGPQQPPTGDPRGSDGQRDRPTSRGPGDVDHADRHEDVAGGVAHHPGQTDGIGLSARVSPPADAGRTESLGVNAIAPDRSVDGEDARDPEMHDPQPDAEEAGEDQGYR